MVSWVSCLLRGLLDLRLLLPVDALQLLNLRLRLLLPLQLLPGLLLDQRPAHPHQNDSQAVFLPFKIQHYFIRMHTRIDMNCDSLGNRGNIRICEVGSEEPKSISGDSYRNETKRNTSFRRLHGLFRIYALLFSSWTSMRQDFLCGTKKCGRQKTKELHDKSESGIPSCCPAFCWIRKYLWRARWKSAPSEDDAAATRLSAAAPACCALTLGCCRGPTLGWFRAAAAAAEDAWAALASPFV